MSEFGYATLILALTTGVVFGAIFLVISLYRIRDYFRKAATNKHNSWLIRILVAPIWLLFSAICLVFTITWFLILFCAVRDYWGKK